MSDEYYKQQAERYQAENKSLRHELHWYQIELHRCKWKFSWSVIGFLLLFWALLIYSFLDSRLPEQIGLIWQGLSNGARLTLIGSVLGVLAVVGGYTIKGLRRYSFWTKNYPDGYYLDELRRRQEEDRVRSGDNLPYT